MHQSPKSPGRGQSKKGFTDVACVPHQRQGSSSETTCHSNEVVTVGHDEAVLFHHFAVHLGRWLDCTNASRVFTLSVLDKFRLSPILYQAVLCFAARHRKESETAEKADHRCVDMLVVRLNDLSVVHDDMLLSAVLILHFADQLNGELRQSTFAQHLTFTSAIAYGLKGQAALGRYFKHLACLTKHWIGRSISINAS